MTRHPFGLALVLCAGLPAFGQRCPTSNPTGASIPSEVRTLEGRLVFHDGIRKWFELKLDAPQCGQNSIELVRIKGSWTPLQALRGCKVRSKGAIDDSMTGYYSLELYQTVDSIEPVGNCTRQSPLPDYSTARPDPAVRAYRVDMHVDYGPGDHPIIFHVSDSGKELRPWQAYASYELTGGFVLYGNCGKGFVVDKVSGTPEAHPSHFTEALDPSDKAAFDPEGASAAGKKDLRLSYTCVRESQGQRAQKH